MIVSYDPTYVNAQPLKIEQVRQTFSRFHPILHLFPLLSQQFHLQYSRMSLERSNTNRSNQGSDGANGQANNFLQRAVKVMKELTQAERSLRGLQSQIKVKKLIEINRNLEQATRKDPYCISVLADHKIIIYIKLFFVENITKAPALTFLRLLLTSQPNADVYLAHNIPLLVCKILEREESRQRGGDWEEEATEALKLMAQWIDHFPQSFPRIMATSLVCFAELPAIVGFQQKKKDHIPQILKLLSIDLLLTLTSKNLPLSLQAGAFTLLLSSITDPSVQERSQDILIRILFFLNEKRTREQVWSYVDLRKIFSVFTDLDYVFIQENCKNKGNIQYCSKLQTQLSLSKQALLTLLKSWNGIILLANDGSVLEAILEALKQIPKKQDSQVRKSIYSLLQDVLAVGQGLLGEGSAHSQNSFRASSLLSSYMIALLKLLMDRGLFKLLIQLSGIDEPSIAEPAQRLLKKLSIYIFNFLPDAASYMDFLISAGTKSGAGSEVLKYSSSFIVSKIGNFVFDDNKEVKNNFLGELQYIFNLDSIYVPLSRTSVLAVSKNLNFLAYKQVPNYRRKLLDMKPIPKENKQNFKKWDWNVIIDLLSFPDVEKEGGKPDSSDMYKEFKLFKYLLRFYSYTRGNFAQQKWNSENLVYIKAGKLLIQNTLLIPDNLALVKNPPQSQFQCTISFMGELEKLLETFLQAFGKSSSKYHPQFFKNLERQLILWIGSFSLTKIGYESLLCENHFFQILEYYLPRKECSYIIVGIMFYLDFYREDLMKKYKEEGQERIVVIGPKKLLIKCVKQGSKTLKLMCIEVIKLLYKAELSGFLGDGLKMLILLALEDNEQLWFNSVETIEDLIRDKQVLESFLSMLIELELQNKESFNKIKNRLSANIYITLAGLTEGYKFIESKLEGWLERQYDRWVKPEASQMYFDNLQALLNNCLSFSKKQSKGYRIEAKGKDWLHWAFLYKLPWLLYVNDAQEVPLCMKLSNQSLLLYAQFEQEQYEFRNSNPENVLKICLGLGSMYLDQELNTTKTKHYICINLNMNKLVYLYGEQYYCASENGISVYFLLKSQGESVQQVSDSEAYANSYDIRRIHIEVKLSSLLQNDELPLHLIQEITKTELGMAFLEKKQFTKHSKQVLMNKNSSTLEVRLVLWSLGYYGSNKQGITTLVKQEIFQKIIDLSQNSPTLSLRGTCRYVLNMLCHSQQGRNQISMHGFGVSKKTLSCYPSDMNSLYKIKDTPELHVSQNQTVWNEYLSKLLPLNQNQKKLFDSISLLINSLSSKYAIEQIKSMIKGSSKISFSFALLQNAITLMSYFKMKFEARKTIHFIFEEFIKSTEFINEHSGKIVYPMMNTL